MTIEQKALAGCTPDFTRLEKAGFICEKGIWKLSASFLNGDFTAEIDISSDGSVSGRVIDAADGEEYLPLRSESRSGPYVSHVRDAYSAFLRELSEKCFIRRPFISDQANRIAELVYKRFGEEPDFPFSGKANETSGVFRNSANRRWYGIVMNIQRKKLSGESGDDPVDVLNVKHDESSIPKLLQTDGIYPAYHMQKRFWVSIKLDDTVSDCMIMDLIAESRNFTVGSTAARNSDADGSGRESWLIPANPSYYDIEGAMADSDVIEWSQSAKIHVGDYVYMYVGVPVRAILWRFIAEKVDIPADYRDEHITIRKEMLLRRDMTFDRTKTGFADMLRYGVKTVRGQRHIPPELAEYLEKHRTDTGKCEE